MILTDKAKMDFHIWMDREKRDLRKSYLDDTCYNALEIEWLDSVGVHIEIGVYPALSHDGYSYTASVYGTRCDWEGNIMYNTRRDATEKAIEKAIEIYNKQ